MCYAEENIFIGRERVTQKPNATVVLLTIVVQSIKEEALPTRAESVKGAAIVNLQGHSPFTILIRNRKVLA